jgi:hypothetical protein
MLTYGHVASGIILGTVYRDLTQPTQSRPQIWLVLWAVVCAFLPDLDAVYHFISVGSIRLGADFTHHHWFSHTPLPYVLAFVFLWSLGRRQGKQTLVTASQILIAGATIHLLLDTVLSIDGIMWLYPLTRSQIVLFPIQAEHGWAFQSALMHSPYYVLEIAVYSGAAISILRWSRLRVYLNYYSSLFVVALVAYVLFFAVYRPDLIGWPLSTVMQWVGLAGWLFISYFVVRQIVFILFFIKSLLSSRTSFFPREAPPWSRSSLAWTYLYTVPLMVLLYVVVALTPVSEEAKFRLVAIIAIVAPSLFAYRLSTHIGQYGGTLGNIFGILAYFSLRTAGPNPTNTLWLFQILIALGFFSAWFAGLVARDQVILSYHFSTLRLPLSTNQMDCASVLKKLREIVSSSIASICRTEGKLSRNTGRVTLVSGGSPGIGEVRELRFELMWRILDIPVLDSIHDLFTENSAVRSLTRLHEDLGNSIRYFRVRLMAKAVKENLRLILYAYTETPAVIWATDNGHAILDQIAHKLTAGEGMPPGLKSQIKGGTAVRLVERQTLGALVPDQIEAHSRGPGFSLEVASGPEVPADPDVTAAMGGFKSTETIWTGVRKRVNPILVVLVSDVAVLLLSDAIRDVLKNRLM